MTTTPYEPSRLEQIERILVEVARQQETNTQAITELKSEVASLLDITMHNIRIVEDDRQAWQAEIRRIWEYLRDRNGGSITP